MPLEHKVVSLGILAILLGSLVINIGLLIRFRRRPINWNGRGNRLRRQPWQIGDAAMLLVLLVLSQLVSVIPALVAYQLEWITEQQTIIFQISAQTILFPLVGFAVFCHIARRRGVSWLDLVCVDDVRPRHRIAFGAFCYVAMLLCFTIFSYGSYLVLESLGYPVEQQEAVNILLGHEYPAWLKVQLVVISIVVAPVIEEIVFRGIALPVVMQRLPTIPAACVVSLLFASMHFHIPSLLPLFVVGFALSLAYIYAESLIVPVTMHALFNGINVLLLFVIGDAPENLLNAP